MSNFDDYDFEIETLAEEIIAYDTLPEKCAVIMNFFRSLSFDQFISILGIAKNVIT